MAKKIIRKWQSNNKRFTIGQDESGSIFAKCNECDNNCARILDFKDGKKIWNFKCKQCGRRFSC